MAEIVTTSWSETDGSNNLTPPAGWPEGMAANAVNDTARAMMGAVKRSFNRQNPIYAATQSTADAYVVTPTEAVTGSYGLYEMWRVRMGIANANTSPTLAISSLAPQPIRKMVGSSPTVLSPGDIRNRAHDFYWDGSQMILRDPGAGQTIVAFGAHNATTQSLVTGDGTSYTVIFGTELFDYDGNFSSTAFTAPADGVYFIEASVTFGPLTSSHTRAFVDLSVSGLTYRIWQGNPFAIYDAVNQVLAINGSALISLTRGQTVVVLLNVAGGTKTVDLRPNATNRVTRISGHRVA